MLARVRSGGTPGHLRPRSHLVLRVHDDGRMWHADAGFGMGTLLDPIPFGPGVHHEQSGWQFRVVQDETELVLQAMEGGRWRELYGFVPEPAPIVDLEVSSWYTSTHPRSPFVTGLIVCAHHADGSRSVLSDWGTLELSEQTPDETPTTPVSRQEIPDLLASRFDLPGFALAADGRLVPA